MRNTPEYIQGYLEGLLAGRKEMMDLMLKEIVKTAETLAPIKEE